MEVAADHQLDAKLLEENNEEFDSMSSRSEMRRSILTFKDDAYVRYILLFSGMDQPPQFSLWWICWVGWRLMIMLTVIMVLATTYGKIYQIPYPLILWYIWPLVIAMITSGSMYMRLPKLLENIEKNIHKSQFIVNEDDVRSATSLSLYFIGVSLNVGIITLVSRYFKTKSLFISFLDFGMECATSPVLGCVLLALSLETCLAKKEVETLVIAAYDQTLTKQQYLEISEIIQQRSRRWTNTLAILTTIAIWNSIGLVVSLDYTVGKENIFHHGDDDFDSEIQVDIFIFIALIKESVLLFLLLFLIMGINDEADSITSILLESEEWGHSSSGRSSSISRRNTISNTCSSTDRPSPSLSPDSAPDSVTTPIPSSSHLSQSLVDRSNESIQQNETMENVLRPSSSSSSSSSSSFCQLGNRPSGRMSYQEEGSGQLKRRKKKQTEENLKKKKIHKAELRRAHLILLSTTYAVKPIALKSWYSYLTMRKTKPISFTVLGFRITRGIALGMFLSFLAGLLNALYRFILLYGF